MSRAQSKARTRQLLVDSARRTFVEKGFNAATIEEIAARAGFTRGAFYANFDDKLEAFWAVVEAEDASMFGEIGDSIEGAGSDEEQLAVLDRWFERLIDGSPLQRAFDEVRALPASSADRERMRGLFARNRRRIADVLAAEAVKRGTTFTPPTEALAAMFLAVADGLANQHKVDPEAVPLSTIGDAFAYLWMGAATASTDPSMLSRESGSSPAGRPGSGRTRS